jgi:septal ring-binding cell division protein DamX
MMPKCRGNLSQKPFSRLAPVRQLAVLTLVLVLGIAAAVSLASCGGGEDAKLLPGTTAQEITENLDTVKLLAGEGECVGAANAAQEVSTEVEQLSGVDAKLKQALQRGAEKLNEVVASCEESSTETVAPASEAPSAEEEEEERLPPGQEKKAEKEREKEEKALEKEEEKQEKEVSPETPTTPAETTPAEPPAPPPSEGGGTDAPGGVSPGAPVGGGD